MTFRTDRTLPHHPAHARVLDTPQRRHATPDDTTPATTPRASTTSRPHRHFGRHHDQR